MITLTKHIEMLLLEHDCVIIPGFGGFISNLSEAKYEADGSILIPPSRNIGFNQQLQINDGLLVQSYMSAYDASYPAAHLQMEKDIEKMADELEINGFYDLGTLGRLTKGMSEGISFEPCDTSILTPSLYGLEKFGMQPIKDIIKQQEIEARMQAASIGIREERAAEREGHDSPEKENKKGLVIRLSPRATQISVAAAVAVLLFFVTSYMATRDIATDSDTVMAVTYPMANSNKADNTPNTVEMVKKPSTGISRKTITSTKKAVKQVPAATTGSTAVNSTTENTQNAGNAEATSSEGENNSGTADMAKNSATPSENDAENSTTPAPTPHYTIVLASYVTRTNADSYIKQIAKEGFKEAEYTKKGKVSRIIYSGYATEQEAQNALSQLKKKSKEFAEAWIMAL